MTPLSWEKCVQRYEGKGYRVLAPAYPGFEVGVEALREAPPPIEALTFPTIVEHIGGIIEELDKPPIINGHSAGGVLTQILLDHGYGCGHRLGARGILSARVLYMPRAFRLTCLSVSLTVPNLSADLPGTKLKAVASRLFARQSLRVGLVEFQAVNNLAAHFYCL